MINSKTVIIDKLLASSITVLLILSASPFFMFGDFAQILFITSSCFFIMTLFLIKRNRIIINNQKIGFIIITVILALFLFLPFRKYDSSAGEGIWFVLFIPILVLDKKLLRKVSNYFSNVIYFISLLALIIFSLKLIGFNIPYYIFQLNESLEKEFFFVYPGTVMLNNQDYILFGRELFRLSGIFSEPGHFGIICCLVIFMSKDIMSAKRRLIVIIAGVLSLSLSFYVLFIGYLFLGRTFNYRNIKYLAFIGIIGFSMIYFLPDDFITRFFLNKIDNDKTVLSARTSFSFSVFYENYTTNNFNLFGAGRNIMKNLHLQSSDYRGFLLKYGYIGLFLYLIWFMVLNKLKMTTSFLLTLFFFLVVFAHRAWMVDYLIFLFAIYAIPRTYATASHKKNNSEALPILQK